MTSRIGLELTEERIRAVTVSRISGVPDKTFEIRWDSRDPRDAVALLRQQLGEVSEIALSIGLAFTHVKHVKLPPVAPDERRGILTLEPDRFFPIESGEIVVATSGDSDLVFAADSSTVESWVAAFEAWAPVTVVEPASQSLARALRKAGVKSGAFEMPSAKGERGVVEVADGEVTTVRRVDATETRENLREAPTVRGIAAEFLPAFGSALGFDAPLDGMLFTPAALSRVRGRRRINLVRSAINMTLALAFAVAAIDRSRTRVLEREQEEISALGTKAEGPAALQGRLAKLDMEASAATSASSAHSDPVAVLAAISRRLPHDAVVMSVRADGDEWQIDGTAGNASNIVPSLDADPALENVRFLSASSHFSERNRTYETFSVAFHARR